MNKLMLFEIFSYPIFIPSLITSFIKLGLKAFKIINNAPSSSAIAVGKMFF